MKKFLMITIPVLLLLGGVGFGVYTFLDAKTRFNDDYVNGNTAGNLYNGGLFCEYGDKIFFANTSDGGKLYVMNADGSNAKKLSDDIASFINADENYVYYVRNNPGNNGSGAFSFFSINTDSLLRIDHDGGHELILDPDPSLYASLVGNYIYYVHYDTGKDASSLYKVKIDGSERGQVRPNPYFTCCANGQYLYYNGVSTDHYIWRLDTATDSDGMLYGGNCWMPIVEDGTIAYFMDCDTDYKLSKVDLMTGKAETLCDDRLDWFNVYGTYIYFQRSSADAPALCRIRTDGSGYEEIIPGIYTNLNATTAYVYFRDYNTGQMFRLANTFGAVPEAFAPEITRD